MGMALTVPRYTVEDLEHFPDDGNRYELLDGMLLVTPSPGVPHQAVATRIAAELTMGLRPSGAAHVFAPGAISLPPGTQLEPDVLVVPARFSLESKWQEITEHWLAVEVLSRSSLVYDREFKRDAYLTIGVREVWLVDTRDKSVEVFGTLGVGELVRDVITWRVPTLDFDVSIDLDAVFAGLG
jgi:Uma2 family endonuclease